MSELATSNPLRGYFWMITCISTILMVEAKPNTKENRPYDDDGASGKRHVDVCCFRSEGYMNWERNGSGYTISKSGITFEMMEWISLSMDFKYECLPQMDSERFTKDNETNMDIRTPLYQLKHGLCDISPQPYIVTYTRFKYYSDFLSPFLYTPFNLLIPVPQLAVGGTISSVWRPFEIPVWTTLLVFIGATIFLGLVNWLYKRNRVERKDRAKVSLELHWLFLYGLLVSKAGFTAPSSFKMRLAGGAWCIAALILTNFYSSVLTSLITVSIPVPIVNSVKELANHDNIELIIQKGFGTAAYISDGKHSNLLLKKLDKKLQSSRDALCSKERDCFQKVTAQKATTFLHDKPSLLSMVSEDYRQTGRCNAAFAKEPFGMIQIAWAISKSNSQYETYQRGMLRMMETGLVDHWKEMFLPTPIQCMVDPSSLQAKMADIRHPALVNLHGLVPAFLFLLFGFILAFLTLILEWITKRGLWKRIALLRSFSNFFKSCKH